MKESTARTFNQTLICTDPTCFLSGQLPPGPLFPLGLPVLVEHAASATATADERGNGDDQSDDQNGQRDYPTQAGINLNGLASGLG